MAGREHTDICRAFVSVRTLGVVTNVCTRNYGQLPAFVAEREKEKIVFVLALEGGKFKMSHFAPRLILSRLTLVPGFSKPIKSRLGFRHKRGNRRHFLCSHGKKALLYTSAIGCMRTIPLAALNHGILQWARPCGLQCYHTSSMQHPCFRMTQSRRNRKNNREEKEYI